MTIKKTTGLLCLLTLLGGTLGSLSLAPELYAAGMPPPKKEAPIDEAKEEAEENSDEASNDNNPFKEQGLTFSLKDPERIKAGEDIYRSTCAEYCHGQEPELFIDRTGLTELYVFETIRDGGKGLTPMPPWGEVFSKEEIWEVVAYLKSLGKW